MNPRPEREVKDGPCQLHDSDRFVIEQLAREIAQLRWLLDAEQGAHKCTVDELNDALRGDDGVKTKHDIGLTCDRCKVVAAFEKIEHATGWIERADGAISWWLCPDCANDTLKRPSGESKAAVEAGRPDASAVIPPVTAAAPSLAEEYERAKRETERWYDFRLPTELANAINAERLAADKLVESAEKERDKLKDVLLSRHGGEPVALLNELDTEKRKVESADKNAAKWKAWALRLFKALNDLDTTRLAHYKASVCNLICEARAAGIVPGEEPK